MTTSSAPATWRHKRGDSLVFTGQVKRNGAVQDFTGYNAAATIENAQGSDVAQFTVEWPDITTGMIKLSLIDTSALAVGVYAFDVQFTAPDGAITSTPNVKLIVQKDTT